MAFKGRLFVRELGLDLPESYVRIEEVSVQRFRSPGPVAGAEPPPKWVITFAVRVYAGEAAAAAGAGPVHTRYIGLDSGNPDVRQAVEALLAAAYRVLRAGDFAGLIDDVESPEENDHADREGAGSDARGAGTAAAPAEAAGGSPTGA